MFFKLKIYFNKLDWILFFSCFLLSCLGLLEIYSIALGKDEFNLFFFKKQLFFVFLGSFLFFFFAFFDFHILKNYSYYIYFLGILLLILVLIFGKEIRGSKAWFDFVFFSFQPVELIKIILIVFLSRFFSSFSKYKKIFKTFLYSGIGVFIPFFLVLKQPDFGSSLLLIFLWFFTLFFIEFPKRYLLFLFLITIVSLIFSWSFLFRDYQKERIISFINPDFNPIDQGYNVSQAIIAIGSGGLIGKGIGAGSQSQLKFLPESQNDFIFAVIAEELGFLGILLILIFYILFFYRSLRIINQVTSNFGIIFILSSVGLIFIEMFINIGMNVGVLPVVGLSLPFVSYGGSAIVSHFIMVGIIESIIIRTKLKF